MERVALALLLSGPLALSCSSPADVAKTPVPLSGPERSTVTIYRDGDRRLAAREETIYRPDGNNRTLTAISFAAPVALVVETARFGLTPGRQSVSLPRVPAQAAASSIWLQSLTATQGVRLDSVEPRQEGLARLLGRRVRVEVEGKTVIGTAIEIVGDKMSVRTDDNKLWLIGLKTTSVSLESDGEERPIVTLEVDRAGEHILEIGYTTSSIDWLFDYHLGLSSAEPGADVEVDMSGLLSIVNGTDTAFEAAEVTAFSGTLSSSKRHPVALWRGRASVAAHSSMAVPVTPPEVKAAIGYEYRPSLRAESGERTDPLWGQSATTEVSKVAWLTPVDGATLVSGKISIRLEPTGELFEALLRERVTGPKTASVRLMAAKGLRGRRTQQATRRSRDGESFTESIKIEVENRNTEARKVRVVELLGRSPRFEIVKSSPTAAVSGAQLELELDIEPGKTGTARYTVRYSM